MILHDIYYNIQYIALSTRFDTKYSKTGISAVQQSTADIPLLSYPRLPSVTFLAQYLTVLRNDLAARAPRCDADLLSISLYSKHSLHLEQTSLCGLWTAPAIFHALMQFGFLISRFLEVAYIVKITSSFP